MAAAKGALEEGEGGPAEAGAELGADGDGRAALSGAGGYDKMGFSPPLHIHTSPRPRGGGKAEDGQNRLRPPGDGSSPWSLPLGTAPGTAVVQPFLWAGGGIWGGG